MQIDHSHRWRVVFDTNILLSAIFSKKGSPFFCLKLAKQSIVTSITCAEILAEFQEKLETKFLWESHRSEEAIAEIRELSQLVNIANILQGVTPDPDDNMILECAIVGNATYVITGDKKFLSLQSYQNILIVTANDFLAIVSNLPV